MLPVAILAGGLATRLRPITETIPKALVEVAGEPFIVWQLRYLREQGVRRVVICTGYLGNLLADAVGDGAQFGLEIVYSPDGPVLLGTGGALRQAVPLLGDAFFVLYGDTFLPVDFTAVAQAFEQSAKPALMTVLKNTDQWDKSNVLFENGVLREYNKQAPRPEMSHIDYGLAIVQGALFMGYEQGVAFDLADLYHPLSLQGQLAAYEVFQRFYEIGSHAGLQETTNYFLSRGMT